MRFSNFCCLVITVICSLNLNAQNVKILFDASKAEMAGNADWVIDANILNIGFNNGPAVVGTGTESNPQQFPSPSQSAIISSTSETYWDGALSYWGVDCAKQNYQVESLPYNGQITYGNSGNAQDLSNYKVFIVCEPNIIFSSTEKNALINFVQNGGGLFMIADHDLSDRNGDGWDSPHIWNDFMNNNSTQLHPFGMTFDYVDISQKTSNIPSLPGDSIIHGIAGNVSQVKWSSGTTITINPTQNATVKGVIYKTGSTFGNSNVMCSYARYGNGKIAALGDSSPCDDGTGDPNDVLYNGYLLDAAGNHRRLLMNITIWLATSNSSTEIQDLTLTPVFNIFPNPSNSFLEINLTETENYNLVIYDMLGKTLLNQQLKTGKNLISTANFIDGAYILHFVSRSSSLKRKLIISH